MGKGGFSKGQLYAQNIQDGDITIPLKNGTATTSVVFRKVMVQAPRVLVSKTTGATTTDFYVKKATITNQGFDFEAKSSGTGTATFSYIAFDDKYN